MKLLLRVSLVLLALLLVVFLVSLRLGAEDTHKEEDSTKMSQFGDYYALVIGNEEYRSLNVLPTATQDARAIASTLESKYGFAVTLLLNANRYDILSSLNEFREKLATNSNLLVVY